MTDIATNLTTISDSLKDIKSAILALGETPTGNITTYANAIRRISGSIIQYDRWLPNPYWWDIKTIIENDTNSLPKYIALFYATDDTSTFNTAETNCSLIKFSDGTQVVPTAGQNVTHTWDKTKDKPISEDEDEVLKTRYAIFYHNQSTSIDCTHILAPYNTIYLLLDCNIAKADSSTSFAVKYWFHSKFFIEKFDFLNDHNFDNFYNWNQFMYDSFSLVELPDKLNTSIANTMQYFCGCCFSLLNLPSELTTNNVQLMNYFCCQCFSLLKLPDYLNLSSCYNYTYFCYQCESLKRLPLTVTLRSSINKITYFCYQCYNLKEIPIEFQQLSSYPDDMTGFLGYCTNLIKLTGVSSGTATGDANFLFPDHKLTELKIKLNATNKINFQYMDNINKESLQYIAENADTVEGCTLVLSSRVRDRAGTEILKILTDKGWTLAYTDSVS